MVVISKFQPIFFSDLTYTVKIVTHLLYILHGVVHIVARDNKIFATTCFLNLKKLTPALHNLIFLCRIFLNTRMRRDDFHTVLITKSFELFCRKSKHLRIATPLYQLECLVTHAGQTFDRCFGIFSYCIHYRVKLNPYFLVSLCRSHFWNCKHSDCNSYASKRSH